MGEIQAIELDIGVPQCSDDGGPEHDNEDQNSKFLADGGEAVKRGQFKNKQLTR